MAALRGSQGNKKSDHLLNSLFDKADIFKNELNELKSKIDDLKTNALDFNDKFSVGY
jgi:polyhydroxyalkanoate synthesis regulator phasin